MDPRKRIQKIQHVVRKTELLPLVERLRYVRSVVKYRRPNKAFLARNPDFRVPPQHLAYDAYSAPDWKFYKESGEATAKWICDVSRRICNRDTFANVLEWGCGPARVLRHVPSAFGRTTEVWGSDYNPESIAWCKRVFPDINFVVNDLHPPLPFAADTFEVIYSISVFTHLSEEVGNDWAAELLRIARPDGLLIISTNGDSRIPFMLDAERMTYAERGIVIRDNFEEGKKMFWACHSPEYIKTRLFNGFDMVEHLPAALPFVGQDVWMVSGVFSPRRSRA